MTDNKANFHKFESLIPVFKLSNEKYDVFLSSVTKNIRSMFQKWKRNKTGLDSLIKSYWCKFRGRNQAIPSR